MKATIKNSTAKRKNFLLQFSISYENWVNGLFIDCLTPAINFQAITVKYCKP